MGHRQCQALDLSTAVAAENTSKGGRTSVAIKRRTTRAMARSWPCCGLSAGKLPDRVGVLFEHRKEALLHLAHGDARGLRRNTQRRRHDAASRKDRNGNRSQIEL